MSWNIWNFFTIDLHQSVETEASCFGISLKELVGRKVKNRNLNNLTGTIDHFEQYSAVVDDKKWKVSVHAPGSLNEFFHNIPTSDFEQNWELCS